MNDDPSGETGFRRFVVCLTSVLMGVLGGLCVFATGRVDAQSVPQIINYQGRINSGGVLFTGTGQFAFALVSPGGTTSYWSNDGSSVAGSQPAAAVSLNVSSGLYSLGLGDTAITNMTAIPYGVFNNASVLLRVWFNDGTHGWQQLSPDQRIAAVGYAMIANSVASTGTAGSNLTFGGISTFAGVINLLPSTSTPTGVLEIAGVPFLDNPVGGDDFVGENAGNFSVTGGGNTGDGYRALYSLSAGHDNTAVGDFALHSTTTGANNTAVGSSALDSNTSGFDNIAIGEDALSSSGTTSNNVAVGDYALHYNTGGIDNCAFGLSGLQNNTTGNYNTSAGTNALIANTTGSYNTAVGTFALSTSSTANWNTAIGFNALQNDTTGYFNDAEGYTALSANTTGYWNTAVGAGSLLENTTGYGNTAIGFNALQVSGTANFNTACGSSALSQNTGGSYNVAMGFNALFNNTTGINNTADGYGALQGNTTASGNTAVGVQSLFDNSTGYSNTAIGYSTLNFLKTGIENVAVGGGAGDNFTGNESNNIDLDNYGVQGESSVTRIGTSQGECFIAGINGVTVSGGAPVYILSNGQLGTTNSSRRYKTDVAPMGDSSTVLYELSPVSFKYKPQYDPAGIPQFGLIAEEVEKVAPYLVIRDAKGQVQSVRYEQVNAMLLNEFLKEHRTVLAQQAELKAMADRLSALETQLQNVSNRLDHPKAPVTIASGNR